MKKTIIKIKDHIYLQLFLWLERRSEDGREMLAALTFNGLINLSELQRSKLAYEMGSRINEGLRIELIKDLQKTLTQ